MQKDQSILKAYIVYLSVTLFLFYEMALQVLPSVITQSLMHDLHIEASLLGIISGIYFYSYMFMQIPAGLLLDRQPSRLLIPSAISICVLGACFFATSNGVFEAMFGRFLMGIGSAVAFISVLTVSSRWFKASYFAVLAGIAQFLGAAGAIGGSVPLAMFVNSLGWRNAMYWLVLVGILLAVWVWFILSNEPKNSKMKYPIEPLSISKSLQRVFQSRQNGWIALYTFCSWGPMAVFAALWGVPYLMTQYNITNTKAAFGSTLMWIGFMIGSPLIGWISNHSQRRLPYLQLLALLGLATSLLALYIPGIPFWTMMLILFGIGFSSSAQVVAFTLVKEINQKNHVTATAIGFNNMAAVAGAAILQPLVGIILHLFWNNEMHDGIPFYNIQDYRIALFIIPSCYLVGWIVSRFLIRETLI